MNSYSSEISSTVPVKKSTAISSSLTSLVSFKKYRPPINEITVGASIFPNSLVDISSSTNASDKNKKAKFEIESARATLTIYRLIKTDEFIEGEISKTEIYFKKLYAESIDIFRESFQKAWLELYKDSKEDFTTFLNISSGIPYRWLEDRAESLVLAACAHSDPLVNEAAIRAIESWEQPSHQSYLKQIRDFNIPWLDEYKKEIIKQLSTE